LLYAEDIAAPTVANWLFMDVAVLESVWLIDALLVPSSCWLGQIEGRAPGWVMHPLKHAVKATAQATEHRTCTMRVCIPLIDPSPVRAFPLGI
jgi:hypothetical protein